MKDPLLDTYSIEELYYEYCDRRERVRVSEIRVDEENDRIEGDKYKSAMSWAEEEEQKELDALKKKKSDEQWMKEQIKNNKEELGEDFGEDLELTFAEV